MGSPGPRVGELTSLPSLVVHIPPKYAYPIREAGSQSPQEVRTVYRSA
jgi:hypothetical protein